MTDVVSKKKRSEMMAGITGRNTGPERVVRSALHKAGFRFRLHGKGLPGRPDLVLRRYQTVIFVHGCFWHRHKSCKYAYTPKSRTKFWRSKLEGNAKRDRVVQRKLRKMGWKVLTVWECQLEKPEILKKKLIIFLNGLQNND